MAANAFRLRRSLAITSSILNHQRHFSSVLSSVAAPPSFSPSTIQQNPSLFDVTQSKSNSLLFQFMSSRAISSRPRYNNNNMDDDQISPDAILFEGCDYNHWLITMDFPKDPKPSPEEMVETYVQTAAKVLGSVEEAKKKIYACSTTTYNGFQVEVSEEVSEQFKGLPGVVFVLPDSYIDPVNKEYGGDKYINGTIIPRPPPVQYGRQGGRYNDRNRDYNRPPRGRMEQNSPRQQSYGEHMSMNNAPGGQGNYQGDIRGPMPSYQANYNEGEGRNFNPTPRRDPGNYAHPEQRDFRGEGRNFTPPVGNYSHGGGGSYGQQTGGQLGQGGGGSYRQGPGGQYGQGRGGQYGQGGGGSFGQGTGGQYGQADGGNYGHGMGGHYGQGGGGNYGQGTGGQYGQGGRGNYGQGTGGQYGQGTGENYGQGTGEPYGQPGSGSYGQGTGGQYSQGGDGGYGRGELRNFGQGVGGAYGPGIRSGDSRTSSQYGENANFPQMEQRNNIQRQQGNYEVIEEAETIKER